MSKVLSLLGERLEVRRAPRLSIGTFLDAWSYLGGHELLWALDENGLTLPIVGTWRRENGDVELHVGRDEIGDPMRLRTLRGTAGGGDPLVLVRDGHFRKYCRDTHLQGGADLRMGFTPGPYLMLLLGDDA